MDWYADKVEVASDGIHVVRHGPWASSTDQEAISFFANGNLLRTYLIRDLVDNPSTLERSVSHFFWLQEEQFDDAQMKYWLTTKDGNLFMFDVRTGEVVSKSQPRRVVLWGAGVFGTVMVCHIAWLLWRRRRRSRATTAESNAASKGRM